MTDTSIPWLVWIVVAFALGSTVLLALRRRLHPAEPLFAVFCGSVALAMLRPWIGGDAGWLWWVVAVGSCATCNMYWLVSRVLFRDAHAVELPHFIVAIGVAALIVVHRVAAHEAPAHADWLVAGVGGLLTLASSTVLVLAFLEPLRGGLRALPQRERRLRAGFLVVYGGCVLAVTIVAAVGDALPQGAQPQATVAAACALAILLFTHWALQERRRAQRPQAADAGATRASACAPAAAPGSWATLEERRLARALLHLIEQQQVFREPELKVADLAARLGSAEHKVSRAITRALGERNINRLLNRHRIAHACRMLEDPACALTVLEISARSGFASLGPFNRAFKAAEGCTPSAYRRSRGAQQAGTPGRDGSPA